jgi:hypothetical protein
MKLHRPLPEGGRIKRVNVSLRRRGPHEEWSVEVTVDLGAVVPTGHGIGAVAVDLGWRVVPGGLRVARWGGEGVSGELCLTDWDLGGLTKPDELRSIRDRNFAAAREELGAWLKAQDPASLPAWFVTATQHLGQWRSIARLVNLVRRWGAARAEDAAARQTLGRFAASLRPDDEDAYVALEAWRYRDHHLWAWESAQRVSSLRHRREVYRVFAAHLARRYEVLVLEDFDLRRIATRAPVGADQAENEVARHHRQLAAVSELRLCLVQAFAARGGRVVKLPAVDTTRRCHACGHVEVFDAAASIHHTCSRCQATWDQDDNAWRNLLDLWYAEEARKRSTTAPEATEVASDGEAAGTQPSRWARARARRSAGERPVGTAVARHDDADGAK